MLVEVGVFDDVELGVGVDVFDWFGELVCFVIVFL